MNKETFYGASRIASGASVVFVLSWAATGAPWTLWGGATAIAIALGCVVGGYIEPEQE